ncbi:hypothetical protein JCM8208_003614 [Rhodotorula glutinis]
MDPQVRLPALPPPATALTLSPHLQLPLTSSSSPNSSHPPALLRLSDELLDIIFILADEISGRRRCTSKPICRRLLPFQRARLYRRVQLRSYKALKSFQRTVTGSSTIAEIVRHLDLRVWDENVVDIDGSSRRRPGRSGNVDDCKMVMPVDFAALVPCLTRLESLETVNFDPQLLDVVFLDQEASRSLASLTDLEFSRQGAPLVPDECDAGCWVKRLACLPRLADLTLRQWCINMPILPAMPDPPTFPYLTRLVLQAGPTYGEPSWTGPALDQLAPNLVELELEDWHIEWFASALATAPVNLRILSLVNTTQLMDGPGPSSAPINAVLARFKTLEELRLGHGALDMSEPTSSLNSLLALDTLQYLIFEDTDVLADDFLIALLADPSHLPKLRTLELNHIYSTCGRTIQSMHGALPPADERRHHPHWPMWDDWVEPSYFGASSEAGFCRIVSAALDRSIVIEGSAYDAVFWSSRFRAEQRVAHLALGDVTGDYLRARTVLGNDVVDGHILARVRARGPGRGHVEALQGDEGGGASEV